MINRRFKKRERKEFGGIPFALDQPKLKTGEKIKTFFSDALKQIQGSGEPITKDKTNIFGQNVTVTGNKGFLGGLKNKRKFVGDIEVTGQTPWSKKSGTGRSIYDVNWLGQYKDSEPDAQGNRMISTEDYNTRAERNFEDMQNSIEYERDQWSDMVSQRRQEWSDMKKAYSNAFSQAKFGMSSKNRHYEYGGKVYKNPRYHQNTMFDVDNTFKRTTRAEYGKNDKVLDNPQSESNPESRNAQFQLNQFIMDHVIPDHGGTVELWKNVLNEIAWHESGGKFRFDPNATQISGGALEKKYPGPGKSFAMMEGSSSKTALNRLFGKNYTDLWSFIQDRETGQFKGTPFLNSYGDTLTWTDYPELEKLYYSQREMKTTSDTTYANKYANQNLPTGTNVGWKGQGENFDVRHVSDESKGILMLMQLMGTYDRVDKPELKLSDYMLETVDKNGESSWSLAPLDKRAELWGEYYQTESNKRKMNSYKADAERFKLYDDSQGVISKWSMPEGSSDDWDKKVPIRNFAPFYTHEFDSQSFYKQVTNSLKNSFEMLGGSTKFGDKSFNALTSPNYTMNHPKDNTNVVMPNVQELNIPSDPIDTSRPSDIFKKEYGGSNNDYEGAIKKLENKDHVFDFVDRYNEAQLAKYKERQEILNNLPVDVAGSGKKKEDLLNEWSKEDTTRGVPNFLAGKGAKLKKFGKKVWDIYWSKEAWGITGLIKAPAILAAIKTAKNDFGNIDQESKDKINTDVKPYEPKI